MISGLDVGAALEKTPHVSVPLSGDVVFRFVRARILLDADGGFINDAGDVCRDKGIR